MTALQIALVVAVAVLCGVACLWWLARTRRTPRAPPDVDRSFHQSFVARVTGDRSATTDREGRQ